MPTLINNPDEVTRSDEITKEKRVEVGIEREQKIVFISGASVNLLYHTSSIYGLTRSTRTYSERPDILTDEPDSSLAETLSKPTKTNFEGAVKECVKVSFQNPLDMIDHFARGDEWQQALAKALEKSWEGFYKIYWENNGQRLNSLFDKVVEESDWVGKLKEMETIVGSRFQGDYYLVAVEATGNSADNILPNISIGTVRKGGDFGFDHEGFHLLLKERWAEDPRIKDIVNDSIGWYDEGGWGSAWKRKFEQAIVVSLDSLLNNHDETYVTKYFNNCNVSGMESIFYPELKRWYDGKKAQMEERTLTDTIYEIINSHKDALVYKYVR